MSKQRGARARRITQPVEQPLVLQEGDTVLNADVDSMGEHATYVVLTVFDMEADDEGSTDGTTA